MQEHQYTFDYASKSGFNHTTFRISYRPHFYQPFLRFANRLRVSGICLSTLHIRFHIRGRHQPHLVAEARISRP